MISITLLDKKDAARLYGRLIDAEPFCISCVVCAGNRIYIDYRCAQIPFLSSILTEHVMMVKEEYLLLDLISSTFYFRDQGEQEQILSIVKSILKEEKTNLPGIEKIPPRWPLVFNAFQAFLTDLLSFDYESFIRFRLRSYRECLQRYVEAAIDEYQLEQDYQDFVEDLRVFLKNRLSLLSSVYLVFNGEFILYDSRSRRIDPKEIEGDWTFDLPDRWRADMAPSILVTLLRIAPKDISLFTDDKENGMIRTICNVFQERVIMRPLHAYVFHS